MNDDAIKEKIRSEVINGVSEILRFLVAENCYTEVERDKSLLNKLKEKTKLFIIDVWFRHYAGMGTYDSRKKVICVFTDNNENAIKIGKRWVIEECNEGEFTSISICDTEINSVLDGVATGAEAILVDDNCRK